MGGNLPTELQRFRGFGFFMAKQGILSSYKYFDDKITIVGFSERFDLKLLIIAGFGVNCWIQVPIHKVVAPVKMSFEMYMQHVSYQ
ncbi:hypothetical protein P8452_73856 [Trifolium repens]|nr:hypothetical protein P8452_73856 [Trifolium repens]